MPRYFFHLRPGRIVDTVGQVFTGAEEARCEARAAARELARNGTVSTQDRIIVTDESGALVDEQPLSWN